LDEGANTGSSWISNDKGSTQVGHHDRHAANIHWVPAQASRGYSQKNLAVIGGVGLLCH
jgi:hypothetical protein